MVAAAAAAITWMSIEWGIRGRPSVIGKISGAVGGLVAITPASGFVDITGALAIGVGAGIFGYWGVNWLKEKIAVDDSLDAFGLHGVCGIIGAILTGVFARTSIGGPASKGWIEGNFDQVITQLYGVGVTIVWCAVGTYVILKIVGLFTNGLRVDEGTEREGLDKALHGEHLP
jgi:Amt family ammonium transporter